GRERFSSCAGSALPAAPHTRHEGRQMRRLVPAAVLLIGIAWFVPGFVTLARGGDAAERTEIDRDVDRALGRLYKSVPGSRDVAKNAKGVLVFPAIYKGGIGIGGEYGKGALRVNGKSVAYYDTAGASVGLQLGGEKHSMALLFQTKEALQQFQNS